MAEEILLYHPLTRTVVENKAEQDSHARLGFSPTPSRAAQQGPWTLLSGLGAVNNDPAELYLT